MEERGDSRRGEPRWEPGVAHTQIFSSSIVAEHEWGVEVTYGVLEGEFCGKVMTLRLGASIPNRVHQRKRELLRCWTGKYDSGTGTQPATREVSSWRTGIASTSSLALSTVSRHSPTQCSWNPRPRSSLTSR